MRIEHDSLGSVKIDDKIIYGIHTYRSILNFPASGENINVYLIKAYLQVKKAAAITNNSIGILSDEKFSAIESAIDKLIDETQDCIDRKSDSIFKKIVVDPYQGGAGTSLNMNINEIIANTTLEIIGKNYGEYTTIHPLDDINMSQSTNDTFPTALKIASMYLIRELQDAFATLQNIFQKKEEEFKNVLKLGRTQYQDAVPTTLGNEFGAYAQATARDRWRLYNAEERLRSVNLGGTAIGTSVSAPREYVLNVTNTLKKVTGLPVAKGEDLIEATQNLDVFTEVHGIVKSGAVSILKICNDLRFLSSGPLGGIGEISLKPRQTGSSIMPGKVNPVILENAVQISELIKGYDVIITNLVGSGHLELNSFIPLISHLFLKSLQLLRDSNYNLAKNCIEDISANIERCKEVLINTTAVAASLIPKFGYEKIQKLVEKSFVENIPFVKILLDTKIIEESELYKLLSEELGVEIG